MSNTTRLRRRRGTFVLASLVLVGLLSFVAIGVASGAGTNLTVAQQPTQTSTYAAAKHATGIAKTDPSLLGLRGSKLVPVMIKYAFTPTASYAGGIKGLKATSPRVTHKSLAKNTLAVNRYQRWAKARVKGINKSDQARRAPEPSSARTFTIAYGGVAARVPANKISRAARNPGGRRDPEGHAQPAAGRQHQLPRRDQRLADAGRAGQRRQQRRRRRDRHRRLAGEPLLRRPGSPRAAAPAVVLPLRLRQRRGPALSGQRSRATTS